MNFATGMIGMLSIVGAFDHGISVLVRGKHSVFSEARMFHQLHDGDN